MTGKLFFRYSNDEGTEGSLYMIVKLERLDVLFERLQLTALPAEFHRDFFKKLTKYKTEKVLHYLDFIELLKNVAITIYPSAAGGNGLSTLQLFLEKHIKTCPSMYLSYTEEL